MSEQPAIVQRADFDFIRYASVWEDADILCRAFEDTAEGKTLVSVASAGDNVLALLTLNPGVIHAADLNAAQLACLELRIAAFKKLEYEDLLAFLGVTASDDRLKTYETLRAELSVVSRNFWDTQKESINCGIIHRGKFERYLRFFGQRVLALVHGPEIRSRLLEKRSMKEQEIFYNRHWNNRRWRFLFRMFFSRWVMGTAGRDPVFFDQVKGSVAQRIFARTEHALCRLPAFSNPYLRYIMTGNYSPEAMPLYLRQENHEMIRKRVSRIQLFLGPVQKATDTRCGGANLSDVFEYLSSEETRTCYAELLKKMDKGARLVYWNMLVPRQVPVEFEDQVSALKELAGSLLLQDKAWFYQKLVIEEIR